MWSQAYGATVNLFPPRMWSLYNNLRNDWPYLQRPSHCQLGISITAPGLYCSERACLIESDYKRWIVRIQLRASYILLLSLATATYIRGLTVPLHWFTFNLIETQGHYYCSEWGWLPAGKWYCVASTRVLPDVDFSLTSQLLYCLGSRNQTTRWIYPSTYLITCTQ